MPTDFQMTKIFKFEIYTIKYTDHFTSHLVMGKEVKFMSVISINIDAEQIFNEVLYIDLNPSL